MFSQTFSKLDGELLSEKFLNGLCSYDIRSRDLVKTSSPSIDILKASNLERLLHILTEGKRKGDIANYFKY